MQNLLIETRVQCPYCWEQFSLLVDASVDTQAYVEDCEICCRPIDFIVEIDEQEQVLVQARLQHE
ncbi:MAG: CPXCG motif-containing cysteine-rich protein [Gammaproteobacteria bacterium]|nr:CPXCG motif-containing cysteine-rich protein [Gammaproteobacteria bacterium]